MKAVRILIADDHEIVRHGVRTVLERQAGWVVSAEASSERDAVAKTVDLQVASSPAHISPGARSSSRTAASGHAARPALAFRNA
jgi:DNA-binding NarL/FixJ family response regulator